MNVINITHVILTSEDIQKLLTKFIENKTKKKVCTIVFGEDGGATVTMESEEGALEESKHV